MTELQTGSVHAPLPTCRGASSGSHHLLTLDNRYRSALPDLHDTAVYHLASPCNGTARFAACLEIEPGGGSVAPLTAGFEHFFYVRDGRLGVRADAEDLPALASGDFAYVDDGRPVELANAGPQTTSAIWFKRRYESHPRRAPR